MSNEEVDLEELDDLNNADLQPLSEDPVDLLEDDDRGGGIDAPVADDRPETDIDTPPASDRPLGQM